MAEKPRGSESDSDFASAESDTEEVDRKQKPSNSDTNLTAPALPNLELPSPNDSEEHDSASRAADRAASEEEQQSNSNTTPPNELASVDSLSREPIEVTVAGQPTKPSDESGKDGDNSAVDLESSDTMNCTGTEGRVIPSDDVAASLASGDASVSADSKSDQGVETVPDTAVATSVPSATEAAATGTSVATAASQSEQENSQPASGWGWGWTNVWSSVSNITETAGKGITSVISTVEESLGIPSPDSIASDEKEEEIISKLADDAVEHDPQHACHCDQTEQTDEEEATAVAQSEDPSSNEDQLSTSPSTGFWSSIGLGSIASSVQSTSAGLVAGGLGALETLGKKTMDILSEGDPGFKKKREMLGGKSMTLSELLNEAKLEAEVRRTEQQQDSASGLVRVTFTAFFDEYQGVANLEALELLSSECSAKVITEQEDINEQRKENLKDLFVELSDSFKIDDSDSADKDDSGGDEISEVSDLLSGLLARSKVEKLTNGIQVWQEKATEPSQQDSSEEIQMNVLYENGMRSLAQTTSITIDLFRKMAEVSLLPDQPIDNTGLLDRAKVLNRFTVLVTNELELLASIYSQQLMIVSKDDSDTFVTSLYLEASNSSSYIQDAFLLLMPVLQFAALRDATSSEH